jgi:hypothetical protein
MNQMKMKILWKNKKKKKVKILINLLMKKK